MLLPAELFYCNGTLMVIAYTSLEKSFLQLIITNDNKEMAIESSM